MTRGRHAAGRDRVQALRHLRLPLRSDRGRAARAGSAASTAPASTPRWPSRRRAARAAWKGSGDKASDDLWFDIAEEMGATEFTGYTGRRRRGRRSSRWSRTARASSSAERGRDGRHPHSTRRRSTARAAGRSATPARSRNDKGFAADVERHVEAARPPPRAPGQDRGGRDRGRRRGPPRGRRRAPQRDPRQPFRDAPAARGAAPAARHACHAEGQPGRARPAALRLLAPQGADAARTSPRSRPR